MKYRRKSTGEKELFEQIWDERDHWCTNCGDSLGTVACAQFFAHKTRKSKDESLRLDKENIILLCLECHRALDQGTDEQFKKRTNVNPQA